MSSGKVNDELERSPKWRARLEEIIDVSAPIFARNGYHATGIAELCAANGLGKGALYHYIGSKEDLLTAIHVRVMVEVLRRADRVLELEDSPSAQLRMLGEELLDVIARHPDHVWVLLHEYPALTGERAERCRKQRQEYDRRVEMVIQAGIEVGEFRDVDPVLVSRAWIGMHNYTSFSMRINEPMSARDLAKPFADIFILGIANPLTAKNEAESPQGAE
jgi:AcrR family transcriptional regulator